MLHRASTILNPFLLPTDAHNVKNAELLTHSKLDKNAPTCFGLHRIHLQGAKVSAWLKFTRLVNSICVKDVQGVVSAMAARRVCRALCKGILSDLFLCEFCIGQVNQSGLGMCFPRVLLRISSVLG